jgi:hypothetical protein
MNMNITNSTTSKKHTNRTLRRSIYAAFSIAAASSLSACYVMPIDQYQAQTQQHQSQPTTAVAPAAPTQIVLNARLYPNNEQAAPFGILNASITNHLNGRGEIMVVQGDELFRGEATRDSNHASSGTANGAGNKGGFMNCKYTMNSSTQGTGTCNFQNNAVYRFHIGG